MRDLNCIFILLLLLSGTINAQTIRAIHMNPPATGDDGHEYIEITHTPNTALTGITFVAIDGDGNAAGLLDIGLDLSGYSTGSNGLLLIRDAATNLAPAPDPSTSTVVFNFIPDIENGTATYLLVTGFSGTIGADYDPGNDGVLNSPPWSSVIDAVSCTDGGPDDDQYADDFGFPNLPDISGSEFDALVNYNGVWYAVDTDGTSVNPGPYLVQDIWDASGTPDAGLAGYYLAPGWTDNPLTASLLPVNLQSFRAFANAPNSVLILFSTASEQNNDRFEIERSRDGRVFERIGEVRGAGEAQTRRDYTFSDRNPLNGLNYYRLLQVDFDGRATFSPIVAVWFGKIAEITVFPSPATDLLQIKWAEAGEETVAWKVFDNNGRLLKAGAAPVENGKVLEVDISRLPAGIYTLRLANNNFSGVKRFIKN